MKPLKEHRGANTECTARCSPGFHFGDMKKARIAYLERRRAATIEDARCKLEGEDWHGVADCAMDLRDIDNELDGLNFKESA